LKNNLSISYSFLLLFLSFSFGAKSQTEPRLVLPIGFTRGVNSLSYSSNGNLVVTTSADNVSRVCDASDGRELYSLIPERSHFNFLGFASISHNSKVIITNNGDSGVSMWDLETGKFIRSLRGHNKLVSSVSFSTDSRLAITASFDSTARVWQLSDGKELTILKGHEKSLKTAVLSKDSKLALTGSYDGTGRIWNVNSGKELKVLNGHRGTVNIAIFNSSDDLVLTASDDNTARVFDVETGKCLFLLEGHSDHISAAVFSPDEKKILTGSWDKTVRIWDAKTGTLIHLFDGVTSSILDANYSPNGELILITCDDGNCYLFKTQNGKLIRNFSNNSGAVKSSEFSPDGKKIITSSALGNVVIWDLNTWEKIEVSKRYTRRIESPFFIEGGKNVVNSYSDTTYQVWDINSGKLIQNQRLNIEEIKEVNTTGKFCFSFNKDKAKDNQLSICNCKTNEESFRIFGHIDKINSIVLSPDDRFLISTSLDHKTILWETATGKPLYTRLQLKDNDWLVYDEHYRFDGTPGAIEKLYFTCGLEVIDLAQMKDSLWVPGLVEKIMSGQEILINDKLAPKLSNLNICDLTPVIEPIEQENKKILKYRITPRNGGLGNTEVYINGNLTYSLKPQLLQKVKEDKKEVYYLTLSTDTLQQYLTGKKNDENPIVVKSKVKGSGIYGRGVELEIAKTNDDEKPQFYGVFIGVNEYGNPQKTANETRYRNLDYAAKDANDLSLAVEKTAGNLFESDSHIYRLTGTGTEAPTKENLQRVLAEIGEKSKASDILYIFFAGHGDIKKGKNEDGQEQDQIRFMLMNADKANPFTTSFGVEELTKWCSPQKIKAQKRVFVFDACHSGKIIDQTMAFNGRGDDEGARIRQLDKLKDKNGMMILAAAADDESAYEDETLNQGVLTYHLLQVMKEQSDTSLVVRNWFDETIDLVKDYSKANGNKQEPSSFGDGRFEIGNVNQDVREAIKITCPKTRVGACVFTANAATKQQFPNVQKRVNEYFSSNGRGDNLVFSKNAEKSYHAQGFYLLVKEEIQFTYDLYRGEELLREGIELPMKKYNSEDELVLAITNSIAQEIEKLRFKDEKCTLNKN
jgi:WD40 repeat protein